MPISVCIVDAGACRYAIAMTNEKVFMQGVGRLLRQEECSRLILHKYEKSWRWQKKRNFAL